MYYQISRWSAMLVYKIILNWYKTFKSTFNKKYTIDMYNNLQIPIKKHFIKCIIFPNSISNKHWKEELSIFLNELLKYTPKEYMLADRIIDKYFICYFNSLDEIEDTVKYVIIEYPHEIPYNIPSNLIYDKWAKLTSEFRIKNANGDKFSFFDLYFLS